MTILILIVIVSSLLTILILSNMIRNIRTKKLLEDIRTQLNSMRTDRETAYKIIEEGVTIYSLKKEILKMHEKYNMLMMDDLSMRYKLGLPPKDENNTFDGDLE